MAQLEEESRPSTAEAIMAALTVPQCQDGETPQYANVIDGLHAVAGVIARTAGMATVDIGFDDEA